jgi:hypothetical protein
MLKLSDKQIDAIRNSELGGKLDHCLKDPRYCLSDACIDVLTNEAPAIEVFTAEQDRSLGPYHVGIRGVPGAYFVFALDHDDIGVFSDLDEARSQLDFQYGEFIVK